MTGKNTAQTFSERILEKLSDGFKDGTFAQYFNGDPVQIPSIYMPCVVVDRQSVRALQGPTGMDKNEITILIKIILSKKDDLGKSDKNAITKHKLEELVEGKDPVTGEYLDQSLKGILRTEFTLDNSAIDQVTSIDYFTLNRPGDNWTEEAHLNIVLEELTIVNNRV